MEGYKRGEPIWQVGFLHTYPITMFLGVLISFLSVVYFWKRMKYSWEILQILVIIIIPSAIFGARFWYLVTFNNPDAWKTWYVLEGLSIQGGVVGALMAAIPYLWTKRNVVDIRTVAGIILPSVLIGQAIGRWGNFANHEVYGRVVDGESLNWLTFIKPHMYIYTSSELIPQYRAPLFFYESMINLIGYILILWTIQRKNIFKPGVPAAFYLMWYGLTRIIMEPLRDPSDILKIGSLQISWFIALIWFIAGLSIFIWFQGLTRPFDKWAKKIFPKKWLSNFKKEYEAIKPIKPRKILFFGEKVTYKKKILFYWGDKVDNIVKIWIPKESKWSKKEINRGKRF